MQPETNKYKFSTQQANDVCKPLGQIANKCIWVSHPCIPAGETATLFPIRLGFPIFLAHFPTPQHPNFRHHFAVGYTFSRGQMCPAAQILPPTRKANVQAERGFFSNVCHARPSALVQVVRGLPQAEGVCGGVWWRRWAPGLLETKTAGAQKQRHALPTFLVYGVGVSVLVWAPKKPCVGT